VNGCGARAAEPRVEVLQADVDVGADAVERAPAALHPNVEQLTRGDPHIGTELGFLVRRALEHAIEDLARHWDEVGMRDPGPIETVARLAHLVLAHFRERALVYFGVAAAGNKRGHPTDRVRAMAMADLHEPLSVRPHEANGHRDLRAIRQDELRPSPERFDDAKEVIPTSGVQTGGV